MIVWLNLANNNLVNQPAYRTALSRDSKLDQLQLQLNFNFKLSGFQFFFY